MKKYLSLALCVVLVCTLFAGCSGASKSEVYAMDQAVPEEAPAAMESANGAMLKGESGGASAALPENRKWIITVHISAETDDLDALTGALDEKIVQMGGYVEDQSIYNGSANASRRYRHANMTVRVPAEKVDQFTEDVAGISNVVDKSKSLEDVTLKYVSTESRVNALKAEEARLLELLAQAETMADLLEIEKRLTDVRYELENYASQLRVYDNRIDYATIYLNITEVQEYTPMEEPTLWERISGGFKDSLAELGNSLQGLLVFAVMASPFVLVYGGIALGIVFLVRKLRSRKKARKLAKQPPKKEE